MTIWKGGMVANIFLGPVAFGALGGSIVGEMAAPSVSDYGRAITLVFLIGPVLIGAVIGSVFGARAVRAYLRKSG